MANRILCGIAIGISLVSTMRAQTNPYTQLMTKAWEHAKAHGTLQPVLSPVDATVLNREVPLTELQAQGFRVVPWTTNEPEKMRSLIRLSRCTRVFSMPAVSMRPSMTGSTHAVPSSNSRRIQLHETRWIAPRFAIC